MELQSIAIIAAWLILFMVFARAIRKAKPFRSVGRRMWIMTYLGILSFGFWGEAAEATLDQYFGSLPVAVYLKYVCLICVCHIYRKMLKETGSIPEKRSYLDFIAPVMIGIGLLTFGYYVVAQPIPLVELRYLVIAGRDSVVLLFILQGFLSGAWSILQRETVPPMRFKLAANLGFIVCIAISSTGSISSALLYLIQTGDPALPELMLRPSIYVGVFFFVLMLIPYSWYFRLLYIQRLHTYYRLRRLERTAARLVGTKPEEHVNQGIMLANEELELAIYCTVISILDCYPAIQDVEVHRALFVKIHRCVAHNQDYSDLVSALAAVRL